MVRLFVLMAPLLVSGVAVATPAPADGGGRSGAPSGARALGVVVIFGVGEQVFDVGPLPELGKASKKKAKKRSKKKSRKKSRKKTKRSTYGGWLKGYRAGFRCKMFSLFWSYVHRWSCSPVVAKGQVVLRPTGAYQTKKLLALQKAIGEKHKLSDYKLSWWAKNGRWVVGGILLLLILSGLVKRMRRRRY